MASIKFKFLDGAREKFNALDSIQKRRVILFSLAVVALVLVMWMYYSRAAVPPPKKDVSPALQLPDTNMAKENWLTQGQQKLDLQEQRIKDLEEKLRRFDKAPGSTGKIQSDSTAVDREHEMLASLEKLIGKAPVENSVEGMYPAGVNQDVKSDGRIEDPQARQHAGRRNQNGSVPATGKASSGGQVAQVQAPIHQEPPAPKLTSRAIDFKKEAKAAANKEGEKGEVKEEFYRFYSPSGSFFSSMLLTGLDAPTGPKAKSAPLPVLIRVQDLSWLPNEVRQNVKGCFVLGEAIGNLSSERAEIRGYNISCVSIEDQKVLDEEVKGFFADTDGKLGLRGRVVSKQGAFLGKALMAAFIEGVAKGFQQSATTVVTTSQGTVQTQEVDGFSQGFRTGAASGFGKAADKLSDFYLKNAEDIFPVIEIGANRHTTFVITQGKEFKFNKSLVTELDDGVRHDPL